MYQRVNLKSNIDSIIAAVTGFVIILLFTRHSGIGICPDGVAYVSTAENFSSLGKCVDFTNNSLVDFPLLYPLFLSIASLLTGLKPLAFGPVLNAALFGLLIFLSGCIIEQLRLRIKWIKPGILSCIVCSPCLLEVYSMMWSETVFLLLLLLFIIVMRRYLIMHSVKALMIAAGLAGLAAVTRYAGVTLIITGGILLLFDYKTSIRKKIFHLFIYTAASIFLLIINLYRNFVQSGTITGLREKSIHGFNNVIADMGSVIYGWLSFSNTSNTSSAWLVSAIILLLLFFCIYQFINKKTFSSYQNLAALFSLIFIVFMLVSASLSRFEQMDSRLLSPIFIPLLFCTGGSAIFIYQKIISNKKKWIITAVAVVFLLFQYGQLSADYETWDGVKDAGIPGYTEDQWRYSKTVNFIEKDSLHFKNGFTIYSNAYDAVHFFTGRKGMFLPHREFEKDVYNFLADQHCYMIWFTDGDNPDLVDMNFITNIKKMRLLKQFDDGAIYESNK